MTAEVCGWFLLAAALMPVLSPKVETGVIITVGLFFIAAAAIAMIDGSGHGPREWVLVTGIVVAVVGEALQWRKVHAPQLQRLNQFAKHSEDK